MGTSLLGKWRLDALLGVGGMAAVYAATHRNGARGALKMLHREQSADEEIRSRFLREGYIANKVEHPGAVRVLDDDVADDGSAFLVMELLCGMALNERAAEAGGRLALEQVMLIADQLLDVLAAAHDKGIVHRDIKPDNVFLTDDGRVKILDFGIARLREPHALSGALELSTTQTGLPMGTPAFMSPEQARGRWDLLSPQSDIWSVGATMFTLLSGQLVHQEQTVSEVLAATFLKPARSLAEALPGAPALVVALVDRALSLRCEDRWPDARTMQSALRDAYRRTIGLPMPTLSFPTPSGDGRRTSAPPVETVVPPSPPPAPRARARRLFTLALGVAAGMAVAVTAAAGWRNGNARAMTATAAMVAPPAAALTTTAQRTADPAAHLARVSREPAKAPSSPPPAVTLQPPPPAAVQPVPPPARSSSPSPARHAVATTLDEPSPYVPAPRTQPPHPASHNIFDRRY